jgi:transcription antitermination factor NusG
VSRPPALPFVVTSGDFDAPGRTEFVRRARTWVAPLVARLARAGVDVEAEPLPAAENHAMALRRAGLGPRAALVLEIDEQAIEAALEIPVAAPEVEVFRHQLLRAGSAERIFGALAYLPEPFVIAVHGDEPVPLSSIDVHALQELLRRAIDESKRLRVGWRLPREDALSQVTSDVALADQLEGALAALAVPFALLAQKDARPPRTRVAASAKLFRNSLPSTRRSAKAARAPVIATGSRVRIQSGPFEGKEAIVQELDGRGGARVRLGLLATWIELSELLSFEREKRAALTRGPRGKRPALGSSHRKR